MPFEPEDITGAVAVWVADDLALSDGAAVSAWADRVSSFSLAQATGGKQPLYRTTGIASQPAVDFDGTDDILRYAGTVSTATSGSVFAVCLFDSLAASGDVWSSADEATTVRFVRGSTTTSGPATSTQQRDNDTADNIFGSTGLSTATAYAIETTSTGTAYAVQVNGNVETGAVFSGANTGDWFGDTSARDNFCVGALKRSSEAAFLNGKVATVVVVDGAISDTDRSSLNDWLNTKYGFSLPVSVMVGQAVETDTATALNFEIGVGQALETDTGGVITPDDATIDSVDVGQAVETDTATTLGVAIGLGQAVEHDTGRRISIVTPPAPPAPHVASPAWRLEITARGSASIIASFTQGDVAVNAPVIRAECMDPLNDIGVGSLEIPLSSQFADELVANRLLHLRILDGDTNPIITSCVMGAPTDVVRSADVKDQTRTVPLQSLAAVLNDSVVLPPRGWNVLPRGDDRRYDWSEPSGPAGGSVPISLGTVNEVNAIPYPVVPYFSNSLQPDVTEVITWSGETGLTDDAPEGTIYSAQSVAIGGGFYKFRGAADNWVDTLRVSGSEVMGFQFGFIDGWESQAFEWSGGDMKIACAWTNQSGTGRGPISLALELINATTGVVEWWTTADFKGTEFPDHAPGLSDGAIARLNLAESQDTATYNMGALVDVLTTFSDEADSNIEQWPDEIGVSTKSRTKLAAFHLHERSAFCESRLRFIDSGAEAGKIAWDYYKIGGRGTSVDVAIEVNVDIGGMSIDREEPAATSLAFAAKDRFVLAVEAPPEGQPVVIGVADYEAAGTVEEGARIAVTELADFDHVKEKIAIEHVTWAADYWTADSIPTVAVDGDGATMGMRVQSMHWWIDENGNLRAEPEFGELFVPVVVRAANAVHRMAPRGLGGRSDRATRLQ